MKQSLIVFFIFYTIRLCGQTVETDTGFLQNIIREKKPDGNIVYTDKINATDLRSAILKLKSEMFKGTTAETQKNLITITHQERKKIEEYLKLLIKPYWQENLFVDSKMIPEQNILPYYKEVYKEYSETYSDPNTSQFDKSNLLKNTPQPFVFEFTPPIYLRDNNLCFVLIKMFCGNGCGTTELAFYKKQNEKWEKYVVVAI